MKFLNPRVHGYLDYVAVALLLAAPTLFGFGGWAASICYVVGAIQMAMSLMTAYPLGAEKLIPFTMHGKIELGVAILFVVAPWLFDFAGVAAARNFFLVTGVGLGLVYLTTDYKAAERYEGGAARLARQRLGTLRPASR
jgi:hypothetical protein